MPKAPTKSCARCGREITWRKRWERCWEEIRYCGERCRRTRLGRIDEQLEEAILRLLGQRAGAATICPSEAARDVAPEDWRPLMERVRMASRRLVARGELEILQKGRPVDPSCAKGPIRLRRRL